MSSVSPVFTDASRNKAAQENQQAHDAAKAAASSAADAVNEAGEAVKKEGKSVYDFAKVQGSNARRFANEKAGQASGAVRSAATNARNGVDTFTGKVSSAYRAGQGTQASPTVVPPHAGIFQRFTGACAVPFTSTAYVAGHATSNAKHTAREASFPGSPAGWAKAGVAGAAAWLGALTLAGSAPKALGFLVKPLPATAGILSIPTVAAYAVYLSAAVAAALLLTRVAVAVADKVKDARGSAAEAPAAAGNADAEANLAAAAAAEVDAKGKEAQQAAA